MWKGRFFMSLPQPSPGGDRLVFFMGLVVLVPGAGIALVTVITWLSAKLYGSLDRQKKRIVWGVIVCVSLIITGAVALHDYWQSRPEVVAARLGRERAQEEALEAQEEAREMEAAAKERAAEEKFAGLETARDRQVGIWRG